MRVIGACTVLSRSYAIMEIGVEFDAWARDVAKTWRGVPDDEKVWGPEDKEIMEMIQTGRGWRRLFKEGKSPRAAFDEAAHEIKYSNWDDRRPALNRAEGTAFRQRLLAEIGNAGYSQEAFSAVLREQSRGLRGTSLRTLVSYLRGETRPTLGWVRLAAQVLRLRPEYLLEGETPKGFGGGDSTEPFMYRVHPDAAPKVRAIFGVLHSHRYQGLPWAAREVMTRFLWEYYRGQRGLPPTEEIARTCGRFFGPLLGSQAHLSHAESAAAACSLAATAYLTAGVIVER